MEKISERMLEHYEWLVKKEESEWRFIFIGTGVFLMAFVLVLLSI